MEVFFGIKRISKSSAGYSLGISLSHNNNQIIDALISGKGFYFLVSIYLHASPQIKQNNFSIWQLFIGRWRVQFMRMAISSLKGSYSEADELLEMLWAKKLRNSDPNCSGHVVSLLAPSKLQCRNTNKHFLLLKIIRFTYENVMTIPSSAADVLIQKCYEACSFLQVLQACNLNVSM